MLLLATYWPTWRIVELRRASSVTSIWEMELRFSWGLGSVYAGTLELQVNNFSKKI